MAEKHFRRTPIKIEIEYSQYKNDSSRVDKENGNFEIVALFHSLVR